MPERRIRHLPHSRALPARRRITCMCRGSAGNAGIDRRQKPSGSSSHSPMCIRRLRCRYRLDSPAAESASSTASATPIFSAAYASNTAASSGVVTSTTKLRPQPQPPRPRRRSAPRVHHDHIKLPVERFQLRQQVAARARLCEKSPWLRPRIRDRISRNSIESPAGPATIASRNVTLARQHIRQANTSTSSAAHSPIQSLRSAAAPRRPATRARLDRQALPPDSAPPSSLPRQPDRP